MSVGRSGSDDSLGPIESYTDVHKQVIFREMQLTPGTNSDGTTSVQPDTTDEMAVDPLSDRGLDPDELAELVYFYVDFWYGSKGDGGGTSGGSEFEGEVGINLAGSEFINKDPGGFDVNGTGTDGNADVYVRNEDSNQYLFSSTGSSYSQNDLGGSGSDNHVQYSMDFRDLFGIGPVLDESDDISLRTHITSDNDSSNRFNVLNVECYWVVHDVESRRPRFGL